MITHHAFNTAWWGAPAGLLRDPAFFARPADERQRLLAPFAWVEYRPPADARADHTSPRQAGFFLADLQIPFRIALHKIEPTPSLAALQVRPLTHLPAPADLRPFAHERFRHLPGCTPERLAQRYTRWTADLASAHPSLALEISCDGRPQGYFLSRPDGATLDLTLAMLRADATLSGMLLYHKALVHYAATGARIGTASFSADNSAVLNIYARLGAVFLPAEPVHLHLRGA